jgi:CRISPR/Cas system-associated exonuclease Cas4 (RecB family)
MNLNCLCSIIDPVCLKDEFTVEEYERIASVCVRINATKLYRIYTSMGGDMSYSDFYKDIKRMYYYDKYVCEHGIEFLYYVKFKDSAFVKIYERLPNDVIKIIKAIGGYNNV